MAEQPKPPEAYRGEHYWKDVQRGAGPKVFREFDNNRPWSDGPVSVVDADHYAMPPDPSPSEQAR
ncbi:MAG: hypothetical protein AAF556_11515, partial [Pseudomonadota bacterium]